MLQFVPKAIWTPRKRQSPSRQPLTAGAALQITDSLSHRLADDASCGGEAEVLANLGWAPQTFTATTFLEGDADLAIKFPSPRPQGVAEWDTVVMDWHFARDRIGRIITAPAVIVLDILQGGNLVAGYISRTLARNGIHAFVLHMPQSGRRIRPGVKHDWSAFLPCLTQGAGDARRARDVVASLPMVRGGVSLQGTSLGGFVATLAASLDGIFDCTVLALTGGDVFGILNTGKMDAARVREQLRASGMSDQRLRESIWKFEPLRIAHRLDPRKTWLFSARHDQVVPARHGKMLAEAIHLDWSHHRQLAGCHYTCAINVRRFLQEMMRAIPREA